MGAVSKNSINLHEQVMQTEGNNSDREDLNFNKRKSAEMRKKDLGHEPPLEDLKEEKIGETEVSHSEYTPKQSPVA